MSRVTFEIPELASMKKYPKELFYRGNLELLQRTKVSIVGSRKPTKYSRMMVEKLSGELAKGGVCVVSGGAMGIDATAHLGAKSTDTIAVLPCGADVRYPAVNKNMLIDIEKNGLLLSQFEDGFAATPWSFVVRNELVVALGSVLVVGEAEIDSGTMRSVEFALAMGKEIFVLPQRLGESCGTNRLLKEKKAEAIYDIDAFVARFCNPEKIMEKKEDEFLLFCAANPTYDEAVAKFPQRVFEAELSGEIEVVNGAIRLA
ncbi:MAG: DNA-protecting protein DprA [Sulfurimonas sp.]|uniref:DNA-processing protein DprA n=1 Tax=Sulfurimonas sp. TaxID=2022749 RepID=UPI0026174236|nr:DNA-processing protein DprA [Sulfurimonas sp.]MDD2651702.1 DNA-protecting protein DprA [Sulfurimonas sp.]MDD3451746.1 DNA-protecting protein DprA [Sulfurimonas sp.]